MAGIKLKKIKVIHLLFYPEQLGDLADDLIKLPPPESIRIGRRQLPVPKDADEFTDNICYGQRLYFSKEEPSDVALILRFTIGYFYPLYKKAKWNEERSTEIVKKVLNCTLVEIYPTVMHLINLTSEVAEREQKLLHREPSRIERAAGIERLSVFSELSSLDFLCKTMNITSDQALLLSYNECLVRFMMQKEITEYQERYMDLLRIESEAKYKKK